MNKKSPYQIGAESLFEVGRNRDYPKNQLVHYQGDKLTHIYQVKKGYLKAYTILDSGDTRTILILSPGDIFGSFFGNFGLEKYRIKYFYQTMSSVTVRAVDYDTFKAQIDTDLKKMQSYLAYLSATNQSVMNQLEVMKNKKALNRVELLLPYLIQKLGKEIKPNIFKIKIRLSHQEVADLSGVTRETTTTLVKQLEKRGVLEQREGHWIIHTDKAGVGPFEED